MNEVVLPELIGSEKQIAWAKAIRQQLIDDIAHKAQCADWEINGKFDEAGKQLRLPVAQEKHSEILRYLEFTRTWLVENICLRKEAKFWIDNRSKNWFNEVRKAYRAQNPR